MEDEATMSSLLDLTVQGDVATITDETKLPQVKLMTRTSTRKPS